MTESSSTAPTAPIAGSAGGAPASARASAGGSGRPRLVAAITAGGIGVALIICGTFLPWVSSGGHGRNIYAITGLADKLGFFDAGPWRAVPILVPLLGPACLAPVVAAILRLRRTAAWTALAIGLLAALLAGATILVAGRASAIGIRLDPSGPWAVLVGGILLAAGGVVALVPPGRRPAGG